MKKKISFMLISAILLFFWGCYPGGPDYAEEMDVVLTSHNESYDFNAKGQ